MSTNFTTGTAPIDVPTDSATPGFVGILGKADALIKQAGQSVVDEFAEARELVTERACGAASFTNAYVRANPWKVVGAVAAAGVLIGTLLSRR